jgi:hypothetical protein
MFGRAPVLFTHVNDWQNVVQVTSNRWPSWFGVFPLKPPTAAYPTRGFCGLIATSWIGRFGRTWLPPVRLTHVAVFGVPVPSPKPYWTLPSFVPTIALPLVVGAYVSWLMNDRSASVPLVKSGLFGYQLFAPLIDSQTRYEPAIM